MEAQSQQVNKVGRPEAAGGGRGAERACAEEDGGVHTQRSLLWSGGTAYSTLFVDYQRVAHHCGLCCAGDGDGFQRSSSGICAHQALVLHPSLTSCACG